MYNIALTGSTYSGKKTVLKQFKAMEIPIFDADVATKIILHYHNDVNEKIRKKFGPKAYEIGFLNSQFFTSDKMIIDLLNLVSDNLREYYIRFIAKHPNASYTIFKCSYLFESGFNKWKETELNITDGILAKHFITSSDRSFFDAVINVWAPIDVRIFRTYSDTVTMKLGNEYDPNKKKELATFNIHSYDDVDLFHQVEKVHQHILAGDFNKKVELINLKSA